MMKIRINIYVVLRVLLSCVFIVSGFEKLMSPYQNFLYVLQEYQMLPGVLEEVVARTFPWIEFLLGVFLLLGLWTKAALKGVCALIIGFIISVGQALFRGLPITSCGCFGEMMHTTLKGIIVFDAVMLCVVVLLIIKGDSAQRLSLDGYYQ